ncbi:SDR family oxidoreductase [Streptococcus sp. FSL E2-3494]|uniref:SDR family oxidoreductase n=1 Tax=Streptococcus sp. FSL E2-3494 TaxID=2954729 RepID=UPI0030FA7C4C
MNKKIAIVTGATGSIGYKIVESLILNNYKVIAIAQNLSKLKNLQNYSPDNIEIYSVNLKNLSDIVHTFQSIKDKYDTIELLINSAGGGPLGGIQEISDINWIENINLKLLGYIRVSREVIPLMKNANNGRIINVVGTFGKQPSPFFIVGSVINAALLSFTKALSLELAGTNITVNAVNPGAVQSLLWKETINQIIASGKKELLFLTDPYLKLVQTEDVVRAVLYLADERNNIITGTSINVDNGAYSGF